jgi:hydroxyquinol 1,2-dioxygenase
VEESFATSHYDFQEWKSRVCFLSCRTEQPGIKSGPSSSQERMRNIDEDNITQAVIARHAAAGDARSRELMTSLVQHLHAFAREVKLSEAEWAEGMRFLGECGRMCSERRQEFVLLSGTLGLSTLVTALNRRKPKGCTESTVCGPFYVEDAPHFEPGADIGQGASGEPCFVRGSVRALDGKPIAGAELQVWQSDADGGDDVQRPELAERRACGILASAADGSFHFKSVVAVPHPIVHDGPVERMLRNLGCHPWRPAHFHFMISAPGYERLVTNVFRADDPYLDSDAVFGVRSSLVADWVRHAPGLAPDGQTSAVPFTTLEFAFVLNATTGAKP